MRVLCRILLAYAIFLFFLFPCVRVCVADVSMTMSYRAEAAAAGGGGEGRPGADERVSIASQHHAVHAKVISYY